MALPTIRRGETVYRSARYVADRYGVHIITVYRRCRAGLLPPPDLTIGKRRHWTDETLDRFDQAHREPTRETSMGAAMAT
jgi:predicted site-specific integrase-resolvase